MPLMYRSCCGFACGLTFGVLIWKPGSFGRSPFSRYFSRVPIVSEDIAAATRVYPPARTHERVLPPLPSRPRQATSLRHCRLFPYFLFSLLLLLLLRIFLLLLFHRTAPHSTAQHRTAPQSSWSIGRSSVDPPPSSSNLGGGSRGALARVGNSNLLDELQVLSHKGVPPPWEARDAQGYFHSQVSRALKLKSQGPLALLILKPQ